MTPRNLQSVFVPWRFLPRLLAGFALIELPAHGHAHPIDEVRSDAILELRTGDRQHFQWTVLLGREHLAAYTATLQKMGLPVERDRAELANTVQRAFEFEGCAITPLPPPAPQQPDPRFSERANGAWLGMHFELTCRQPVSRLHLRRVGYSAARTRTTLYLAVTVGDAEPVRALLPPSAEAVDVPLDGNPARPSGDPVSRRAAAKDTATGALPSAPMTPGAVVAARSRRGWALPPRFLVTAWAKEGALHLARGPDHLLFLLTLVVAAPSAGALLAAVTAFSLGHLSTMALALALNLPPLPFVDIAIGATIAGAAFRARRPRPRGLGRLLALTAGFGLIHGLGFGSGLQRLVAGTEQVVWPLLSFGLGLDAAQVIWVLCCGLLWRGLLHWVGDPLRAQRRGAEALMASGAVLAIWATFGDVP